MEISHFRQVEFLHSDASGKVRLFRCWDPARKKVLCLKERLCESIGEFNALLKEGVTQTSLTHQGIRKMYECFVRQDEDRLKCVFVTEWLDRTLKQEVEDRAASNRHWDENSLLEALYSLVDALAYAQNLGVAHRNIHPESIYVTQSGAVAIGDFGFSVRSLEPDSALSNPENARFQAPSLESQSPQPPDPYRCDVFSLGVISLYMAKLQLPSTPSGDYHREIESIEELSETTKELMREMLKLQDEERPDFLKLREVFRETAGFGLSEEALALESRKRTFRKCLSCSKRIFQKQGYPDLSIVPLQCNPSRHIFCSAVCFKRYIATATCDYRLDLGSVVCPKKKCRALIYPEFSTTPVRTELVEKRTQKDSSLVRATLCAQCSATVPITQAQNSEHITLPCNRAHTFCCKVCFLDYLRESTEDFQALADGLAECPMCQSTIPLGFVVSTLGGQQKFDRLVAVYKGAWSGCTDCGENQAQVQLHCGHSFCRLCVRSRYEVYRIQGRKNWLCPVCRAPIQGEQSLNAFCEVF